MKIALNIVGVVLLSGHRLVPAGHQCITRQLYERRSQMGYYWRYPDRRRSRAALVCKPAQGGNEEIRLAWIDLRFLH